MKLLWVKANKPGSRLIRWGLGTKSSHFAVCFDEDEEGGGIVFHSYGKGPQMGWFGDFLEHYEIVFALSFKSVLTLADEESIYKGIIKQYRKQWYDYAALAWWAWRVLLLKFFRQPLPEKNAWAINGFALCTAVSGGIKWVSKWAEEHNVDLEMVRTDDLYRGLLESSYFADETDWVDQINSLHWKS